MYSNAIAESWIAKAPIDRCIMFSNWNCLLFSPPMGNRPQRASPKLYEEMVVIVHFASVGHRMVVHDGSQVRGGRRGKGVDAAMSH